MTEDEGKDKTVWTFHSRELLEFSLIFQKPTSFQHYFVLSVSSCFECYKLIYELIDKQPFYTFLHMHKIKPMFSGANTKHRKTCVKE